MSHSKNAFLDVKGYSTVNYKKKLILTQFKNK